MKPNILHFTSALLFIGIATFCVSCSPGREVEKLTLLQKMEITNEDTTDGSQKFQGEPHSGKYFSHTDSSGKYGSGTNFVIPDSLLQKDIRVKVNLWVKQGDFNEKCQLAISLEEGNNGVKWMPIEFKNYVKETNKWINVIDSVTFPGSSINKSGLVIKIFPYNPEGTSYMDIDDEQISIYKVEKIITE